MLASEDNTGVQRRGSYVILVLSMPRDYPTVTREALEHQAGDLFRCVIDDAIAICVLIGSEDGQQQSPRYWRYWYVWPAIATRHVQTSITTELGPMLDERFSLKLT